MDAFDRRNLAYGIVNNPLFQELYQETYSALLKKLELANPNQPEVLVQVNSELRGLRSLKNKIDREANKKIDGEN